MTAPGTKKNLRRHPGRRSLLPTNGTLTIGGQPMPASPRYDVPTERPLKAYAFDPSQGRNLGNFMTLNVRNEPLTPGPVGKYLAVIDYDASNDRYYEPVDLND